jgi:hypothetical protein
MPGKAIGLGAIGNAPHGSFEGSPAPPIQIPAPNEFALP